MGISLGTLLPLQWRLWIGVRVFGRPYEGPVTRVSWHRVIKGPCRPPEVEAMQYVAKHTNVPVPKVYAVHNHNGYIYIEMEWIRGRMLEEAWRDLTKGQKDTIMAEVKQAMATLHALEPPANAMVSSALLNPVYDCRIGNRFFGPVSMYDFHAILRFKMPIEYAEEYYGNEIVHVHTHPYRLQFCHSDFAARNIIVHDGRLAAIIDWGFSGWYPEYWDYTRAHFTLFRGDGHDEWMAYMPATLGEYRRELEVEKMLWEKLPDPGARFTIRNHERTIEYQGTDPSPAWLDARGPNVDDLWTLALSTA